MRLNWKPVIPMRAVASFVVIVLFTMAMQARGNSTAVELEALLGQSAVLMINGERKMLRVGQSHAGVTLVSAQPTNATLEINGRTETVGLSQRVGTTYQQADEQAISIPRDALMQYLTTALINGRSAQVLVDTGANIMAISSSQAKSMGIDYSSGTPAKVETASGLTGAYAITLNSVSVGGIQVENVPAMIVHGDYPVTILLGMSYLRHVKMVEHNGILSLSRSH